MMAVINAKQMINRIQQRAFDLCEHLTLVNTCSVTINEEIFPILKTLILIRTPGVTITHSTLEAAYFVYCTDTNPLTIKDSPELEVFEYGCSDDIRTELHCEAFNKRVISLTPTQILGALNKYRLCHLDPVENLLLHDDEFKLAVEESKNTNVTDGTESEEELMYYSRSMIESSHELEKKMDERYRELKKEKKNLEEEIKAKEKLLYESTTSNESAKSSRYLNAGSEVLSSYVGSPSNIPRKMTDSGFEKIEERVFKNRYNLITSVNAGVEEDRLEKLKAQINELNNSESHNDKRYLRLTDIK